MSADEILVNTYTSGSQYDPAITSLSDGFVVTWRDNNGGSHDGGSGIDVFGQRFDAGCEKVGEDFLVNADADSGAQYEPAMADLGNGKSSLPGVMTMAATTTRTITTAQRVPATTFAARSLPRLTIMVMR